jgi:AcrR family transcriptional regulator
MNQENFENQQGDTKQRILDAAEHLFALEGFRGTSLRDITGRAGVNLAAVNYHFGSKEALLRAVMERRLIPLNQVRIERLTKVRDSARQKGRFCSACRTVFF